MICYQVILTLSKPLPTMTNKYGHTEFTKEIVERINDGIYSFNENNHGRCFAFIFFNSLKKFKFAVISKFGQSIDTIMNEVMNCTGINGSYDSKEITLLAMDKTSRCRIDATFEYNDAELEEFCIEDFTRFRPSPREELARSCKLADIKKAAVVGQYDESFLPELERIRQSPIINDVKGHPVHYIIRCSRAKDVCDTLISQLYKNGRVRSKRYCILNDHVLRNTDSTDLFFQTSICSTVVIDLSRLTEQNDDRAVNNMLSNELFDNIKKYNRDTLVVFTIPNELESTMKVIKNALPEMTFVEITERLAKNDEAKKILRSYARKDKIRADKQLINCIASDTGYYANDLRRFYEIWYANALKTKVYPQYADFKKSLDEKKENKPEGSAYEKLSEMIGLENVKELINKAVAYSKLQKDLADRGMPNAKRAMHMVFTGHPGTAKTTVARLLAQILKDNKVLSVGNLIECGRSDLVGKYVGWTAVQVKDMFKKAKGSVLFIDEAYSLLDDRGGSYGDEAINTIVQEMENHREDMVVIFAGYPKEMNDFINRNPGLRSRISFYVDFKNYDADELFEITKLIAKNNKYKLSDDVRPVLMPIFERVIGSDDFGNGRYARNLVEQAQLAQAIRLSKCDTNELSGDDLVTLRGEDFADITTEITMNDKITARRIGFTLAG